MGSGDRLQFYRTDAFGLGLSASRFPFELTLNAHVLFWCLSIGMGKGYDQ